MHGMIWRCYLWSLRLPSRTIPLKLTAAEHMSRSNIASQMRRMLFVGSGCYLDQWQPLSLRPGSTATISDRIPNA
eukprot:2674053-Rhodomonas_salina.1